MAAFSVRLYKSRHFGKFCEFLPKTGRKCAFLTRRADSRRERRRQENQTYKHAVQFCIPLKKCGMHKRTRQNVESRKYLVLRTQRITVSEERGKRIVVVFSFRFWVLSCFELRESSIRYWVPFDSPSAKLLQQIPRWVYPWAQRRARNNIAEFFLIKRICIKVLTDI